MLSSRGIRWLLGLALAAAFTWGSLLLLDVNPLGFVLLGSLPVLVALAHRPTKDRVLTLAGLASGPILTAFICVSARYLEPDAFLTPASVLRGASIEFPIPLAFSISWAFLAWRAPSTHRWVRHSYRWWPAPVCAWGVASLVALRYYVLESRIHEFPEAVRFDILWVGVLSSIVGLIGVTLPLVPVAARDWRRGTKPGGLQSVCLVVLVVAADWVFHGTLLSRIWLLDRLGPTIQ